MNRTIYDITHLLESAEDAGARVRRVLERMRDLVPYEQCALLEVRPGQEPQFVLMPEPALDERALLTGTLLEIFGKLVEVDAGRSVRTSRPSGVHLAVPLIGRDEVIGLLFVRSSAVEEYTEEQVRALSVVAAQLATYLTTLRARAELVELARERDEARRAAEAANRAKDEFLALVSHELKTPLSSILAWTHVLRSPADDAARARAADELERNVMSEAKLVDDILDLASIASAELRLNLRTIEPASLIHTIVEDLRIEAERKSIRLESNIDAAATPLVIDRERMSQVVSVLIANAIRFTPTGGHVGVSLDRAAGFARIRVSDGRSGIPTEDLPHVFDRFRPASGAASGDALGVGLAIVKDVVELHGGRIRVESAASRPGATFSVEIPHGPMLEVAASAPSKGEHAAGRLLDRIRVLLVDHDPGLCESFQAVLHDYGAEVMTVATAAEALAVLEQSRPDVLLFGDLALQGEIAYDLMRAVTARAAPVPIASISSWRAEDRERETAAGFRLHLAKPIDIGALVEAVAELADRKR